MNSNIKELESNQELRPYFLDFICKNFVLGLTDIYEVKTIDRLRMEKEFHESMFRLSERILAVAPDSDVLIVIEEVCKQYFSTVGTMRFHQN